VRKQAFGPKGEERDFLFFLFLYFYFIAIPKPFKSKFEFILILSQNHSTKQNICSGMNASQMFLHPMMNF
jgi:hypothetical protein